MYLTDECTIEQLYSETEWLEGIITETLDGYALKVRVCKRSKPWWDEDIKEKRKSAERKKRLWKQKKICWEELKKEEKILYRMIRRKRRECWAE
jgi:hypothetical protein